MSSPRGNSFRAARVLGLAGILMASAGATGVAWADALGTRWVEREAGFNGTWTRRGNSDVFDAVWTHPRGNRDQATLRITIAGNRVQVIRTQSQGTCTYQGTLSANGTSVTGTYTCSWSRGQQLTWTATIVGATAGPPAAGSGFGLWAYRSNIALPWTPCNIQYVLAPRGSRYETLATHRLVRSVPKRQTAELLHRKFSIFYYDHPDGVVKMSSCRDAKAMPFDDPDGGRTTPATTTTRHGDPLGRTWSERESGHAGTWRRRGNSNVFDGSWSEGTRAVLTITMTGQSVRIVRREPKGTCNYVGAVSPDRRTVRGKYRCPWMSAEADWSATIQ